MKKEIILILIYIFVASLKSNKTEKIGFGDKIQQINEGNI